MENIDDILKSYDLGYNVWTTINCNCRSRIAISHGNIGWIEYICCLKNSYHKLFDHPLKKGFYYLLDDLDSQWWGWFKSYKCNPITVFEKAN